MNHDPMYSQSNEITPSGFEGDSSIAMPVGTSDFADEPALDPLAGANAGRRIPTGSLWVLGVVILAVGGLFSMKFMAAASARNTVESGQVAQTVDNFLKTLRGEITTDDNLPMLLEPADDAALEVLNEVWTERQVPLRDLQRDPFVLFEVTSSNIDTGSDEDPEAVAAAVLAHRRQQREAELRDAASYFTISSIMGGSKPLATINGEIVRIGDELFVEDIDLPFVVSSINNGVVVLEVADDVLNVSASVEVVLDLNR